MKKLLSLTAIIFGIMLTFAQAPEKFSYQAVIRNASNALVTNANVGVKISILKTSAAGTVVYAESQTPTTNANGLISIQIGAGTVISGTIAGINWSSDSYFIKTETDPTGGTSYTIAGTTQLLSVPYALYSKNSGASFTLPYAGTSAADNVIPFKITNSSGTLNQAGAFENTNATNSSPALTGKNNSVESFGTGVEGRANSNTNGNLSSGVTGFILGTGTGGAGVYGYAQNAYGIYGSSDAGSAVRGVANGTGTGGSFQSNNTGHALTTYGPIQLLNIGAGAGKVLTSDGGGNATWQDLITPDVHITSLSASNQSVPIGTVVVINTWTNLNEAGGANYNPATGIYTVPVNGYYSVAAQVGYSTTATSNALAEVFIQKNANNVTFGLSPVATGSICSFLHVSVEMHLVAGDQIRIALDHNHPTPLVMQANLSSFAIHLIHK